MGIYDRDYYREPQRSGIGRIRMWSVTTWLIIVCVAVFVIDAFLLSASRERLRTHGQDPRAAFLQLRALGEFSIAGAFFKGQVWRMITCQFLHLDIWHLLVNMIGLYMFGPIVELNLGARRYSFFYLLCGIAGPLMYTVMWATGLLIHSPNSTLVGASAGIFGVLLAAAYLSPDRLVYVYFFEVPLKYFAWIMMGIAAYIVLVHGGNAGGQAAHLGGGLLGWFLIRSEGVLDVVARKRLVRGRRVKDWSRDMNR